jgi:superfamily I DNA/RNA helicase
LDRVVENLYPSDIDEVLEQPDLVVQETEDLVKYKQGDLLAFLLKLDPRQEKLVDWALDGPTMVKGGPGTGKSTVALYRVKSLLEKPESSGDERVLFTTFTRALVAASEQLLKQLLSEEQFERVKVLRCDQVAWRIANEAGNRPNMLPAGQRYQRLQKAMRSFEPPGNSTVERKMRRQALEELGLKYLLEEFKWIIEGRGLETFEEYREASRAGRGIPFGKKLRETVWALHQDFLREVHEDGYETWGELRNRALDAAESGAADRSYDYVVVDEAQDLTPSAMALMAEIAESPEGIFMASDHKQSIYSRNYAYTTVHPDLQFVGRTRILRRNYRSTEEIERAAFPLVVSEDEDDPEMAECVHSGPMPVLVRAEPGEEESKWVAKFAKEMSRHLRFKLGSTGVLVPTSDIAEDMAEHLSRQGLPAEYYKGENIELDSPEVKVVTLHSSKGLEFPTAVVCGLYEGTYPHRDDYDDDEYRERMRVYRRLLYVAMTRAMRGLMVVVPDDTDNEAIELLHSEDWFEQGV